MYDIQYNICEVIRMNKDLFQNYSIELRRGTQILSVLSQLKEKEYGYSLLQKLVEKNVNIEAGTLYPLLRRLESQGILTSEWDTSESRPRKYYFVSDLGEELYKGLKEEWASIVDEMNGLLEVDNK